MGATKSKVKKPVEVQSSSSSEDEFEIFRDEPIIEPTVVEDKSEKIILKPKNKVSNALKEIAQSGGSRSNNIADKVHIHFFALDCLSIINRRNNIDSTSPFSMINGKKLRRI